MDQLIIPKLMFFYSHHLSGCYCMDIVRRNSVSVTHGSLRLNLAYLSRHVKLQVILMHDTKA